MVKQIDIDPPAPDLVGRGVRVDGVGRLTKQVYVNKVLNGTERDRK